MYKSIKDVLTKKFLSDWLSTAIYGNFWCECSTHVDTTDDVYENAKKNNTCREEIWADVLLNGGALNIVDVEEWDLDDENSEAEHKLTLADIEKVIPLFMLNYPRQWANIIEGQDDLIDADALLQFAVFGDWIYG